MAGERETAVSVSVATSGCEPCSEALELDRVHMVRLGTTEIALIGCAEHVGRMLLAIETLEGIEHTTGYTLPPLPQVLADDRIIVRPEIAP